MVSETDIKKMVEQVLREMGHSGVSIDGSAASTSVHPAASAPSSDEGCLPDITAADLRSIMLVPHPKNKEALLALKKTTPARIGVWRAGPRYKTETLLRFRADHAAAMDAVFSEMSEDGILKRMKLPIVQTLCTDKDNYLTRPDLGRKFDQETKDEIQKIVGANPKVLIIISDGLSTTAVEACAEDTYKAAVEGLKRHNIDVAPPFFVKYGRVPAQDEIGEITGAEVVVSLIGERPGLVTAESMSAYMVYKPKVGIPEARRTVVSNIHKGGTPPVEAGAYIADIIKLMLEKQTSGIDLKL